jgi:Holliday junction resolvase RusA-like endonuclease
VCELIVELPYPLRSKSNFRRGYKDKDWSNYKNFEKTTQLLLLSTKPSTWVMSDPNLPVSSRKKIVVCIASQTVLDVGNYSKSLLDAAEGVLFFNDSEVTGLTCIGSRSRKNPITVVGFRQLDQTSTIEESNKALGELTENVLIKFNECIKNNKRNNIQHDKLS